MTTDLKEKVQFSDVAEEEEEEEQQEQDNNNNNLDDLSELTEEQQKVFDAQTKGVKKTIDKACHIIYSSLQK
ncbi:hypothetical protein DFH08DRAFT_961848 [Mycena albidolilacea]|uniref:Uncharacterized protein n=1 Tax=Mycena albidolilacea TaxID=1033008 RepID=A0AAD7ER77_9AGAR|nr:hypothetical protein DFH08DRAFT_961848 [Mycena albidolilacea]